MQTKQCKECLSDIPKKAKKCSQCSSDQRNYFQKHPIITIFIIIFFLPVVVIMTLASSDTGTATNTPIPVKQVSQAQIRALEIDLQGWAEGRWDDIQVGQDSGEVIVKIHAMSGANEVALNGYCKILKDSVREHTLGLPANLFIYQNNQVAKACI